MTESVRLVSHCAFSEFGLSRLTGITFHTNKASGKVLEKAGFSIEGVLRENCRKDGRVLNGILYSLLKDGASNQFDPRLDILLRPIGQVKSTRKKSRMISGQEKLLLFFFEKIFFLLTH